MRVLLSVLTVLVVSHCAQAQCITTYPYTQDFETSDGGWTSGGTFNDWAWGSPAKAVITQAASGSNCWVTGGLTGSFYSLGQRSYVQSPCFDFTNLKRPYISFNIWWESEKTYDGATLQYSTDNGTTWTNIGGMNDTANCFDQNWYNSNNIVNLNGLAAIQEGWTGNSQTTQGSCQGGNGSNGWRVAKHCMAYLEGRPQVVFRFAFGAGTTCNNFDGIAFDDVIIEEGPFNTANFSYTCSGTTINFTGEIALCPNNLRWNFGDGSTGSGINPSHTYATPGVYPVTFTAPGPCDTPATITKQVQGIEVSISTVPVSCNGGSDGAITATVVAGTGPFTYSWNTSPPQSGNAVQNIGAGPYMVTVTSANQCIGTASAVIDEPAPFSFSFATVPDTCGSGGAGSIAVFVTGAQPPYTYAWSNGGTDTFLLTQVLSGNYQLTVTDANNCFDTASTFVSVTSGIAVEFVDVKSESCYGKDDGSAKVRPLGGTLPFVYQWSTNSAKPEIIRMAPGIYVVTITDASGCIGIDSVTIEKEICRSYLYFPSAFSPNGDGENETFKPRYSSDVVKYSLNVFNRWGEKVFETMDITNGWDGFYQGQAQPLGVYVWYSEYSFFDGNKGTQSGNITIMK